MHGGGDLGDVDADYGSGAGGAADVEIEIGTVEDAETFADIAEANSFYIDVGHFFFGDANTIVFNFQEQATVTVCGAKLDFSAFEFGGETMLQTIFDNGLQQHTGNERFQSVFVEIFDDVEVIAAEAGDFDVEIVVNED